MNPFNNEKKPADVLLNLAEKFKFIRKKAAFSQQELAERSGVSLGSIKRFEQTGQIALESLLKLALILNRLEDFNSVFSLLLIYRTLNGYLQIKPNGNDWHKTIECSITLR